MACSTRMIRTKQNKRGSDTHEPRRATARLHLGPSNNHSTFGLLQRPRACCEDVEGVLQQALEGSQARRVGLHPSRWMFTLHRVLQDGLVAPDSHGA